MEESDVIIVGGGLAGLTAAIALSGEGHHVRLIERHAYPRHKVCGEYLSQEVIPLLKKWGIQLEDAPEISEFLFCGPKGRTVKAPLPLGGIGISRFALDKRMADVAQASGADVVIDQALSLETDGTQAVVKGRNGVYKGRMLLSAWGKRSVLDRESNRDFWKRKSRWMALKMHFGQVSFPREQVGLYFFKGGYAGCSLTEAGHLNFCCLIEKQAMKALGSPQEALGALIQRHPGLRHYLEGAKPLFDKPLSIAEIDFGSKDLTHSTGLYCGDAAHLIHPLCGNGMAMAIHSGHMAASLSSKYLNGQIENIEKLGAVYSRDWSALFSARLRWGRYLQRFLTHPSGMQWAVNPAVLPASLLRQIIKRTHGSPLEI